MVMHFFHDILLSIGYLVFWLPSRFWVNFLIIYRFKGKNPCFTGPILNKTDLISAVLQLSIYTYLIFINGY